MLRLPNRTPVFWFVFRFVQHSVCTSGGGGVRKSSQKQKNTKARAGREAGRRTTKDRGWAGSAGREDPTTLSRSGSSNRLKASSRMEVERKHGAPRQQEVHQEQRGFRGTFRRTEEKTSHQERRLRSRRLQVLKQHQQLELTFLQQVSGPQAAFSCQNSCAGTLRPFLQRTPRLDHNGILQGGGGGGAGDCRTNRLQS